MGGVVGCQRGVGVSSERVKPRTLRVDNSAGRHKHLLDTSFMRSALSLKKGEEWRRMRNAFALAFSTSKLKKVGGGGGGGWTIHSNSNLTSVHPGDELLVPHALPRARQALGGGE